MKITELRPEAPLPPPSGYILELNPDELAFLKCVCLFYNDRACLVTASHRFIAKLPKLEILWNTSNCFVDTHGPNSSQ